MMLEDGCVGNSCAFTVAWVQGIAAGVGLYDCGTRAS